VSRYNPSEEVSTGEFNSFLHEQIRIFADSFGPEGHIVEDEYREISVSRLAFESGFKFIAGRPYKEDERIFISLCSSESNQAGSKRIATWPYRDQSKNRPIDPGKAFVEIQATHEMIIEGNS